MNINQKVIEVLYWVKDIFQGINKMMETFLRGGY